MSKIISNKISLNSNDKEFDLILTTISNNPLAQLPNDSIKTISKTLETPYEVTFIIPKYTYDSYTLKRKEYLPYSFIKNERKILINNSEIYIIKNIQELNDSELEITAKSGEVKLGGIDVNLEDCFISFDYDNKENEELTTVSLNKLLIDETGWKLGIVTDSVKLMENGEHKERFIENISKKWYEFLTKDITEYFDCVVFFDTWNRTVNYFKEEEIEDVLGVYLSKDNFIISLEKEHDSNDLVTVLRVEGNSEMDISNSVCTGGDYVENYSYFMENGEMSEELVSALETYYEMVEKREPQWKKYSNEKVKLETERDQYATELIDLNARKMAYEHTKEDLELDKKELSETDTRRIGEVVAMITNLTQSIEVTKNKILDLENRIDLIKKSMDNIVALCKKKTSTDDNGKLIFTSSLLDELREYYFVETYSNDSFITENVGDLIKLAKRKLMDKCKPTKKWNINVVDFLNRITYKNGSSWKGSLSLGNLIILYDKDKDEEEFVYFIGYEYEPKEGNLSLTLSNKKTVKEDGLIIADYLSKAKNMARTIESKKYLLLEQKYKRMNVPREFIPKYKEKEKPRPNGTVID